MTVYLARKGFHYSPITIHKYMNTEMGLYAIVRPKKPEYLHGKPHKVFENKLAQNFTAERANQKWCTDFTYLFLKNGEVRYDCSILDLYDRSIIASITDRHITSELAIRTLQKALDSQPLRDAIQLRGVSKGILFHTDRGSQFTSSDFRKVIDSFHLIQSFSANGHPYHNAVMECFFKYLKKEELYRRHFQSVEQLKLSLVSYFAGLYNPLRPHSHNNGLSPNHMEDRYFANFSCPLY